jgi:hypothetical protein
MLNNTNNESIYGQSERGPPEHGQAAPQTELTVTFATTLSNGQSLTVACSATGTTHKSGNVKVSIVAYNETMIAGEELAKMTPNSRERLQSSNLKTLTLKAFGLAVAGGIKYYLWYKWHGW